MAARIDEAAAHTPGRAVAKQLQALLRCRCSKGAQRQGKWAPILSGRFSSPGQLQGAGVVGPLPRHQQQLAVV